jgi:hypothetical protein
MTSRNLAWVAAVGLALEAAAPVVGQISTPASREGVVALATTLAVPDAAAAVAPAAKIDPFNPPAANLRPDADPEADPRRTARSEEDLVTYLISQIQPTGSITLGGEPYLLFTERRQKIGDKMVVVADKVEYAVEIVSIGKNRFRIRYNGHEAERSIK